MVPRRLLFSSLLFLLVAAKAAAIANQWTPLGPYDLAGAPISCQSLAISPDGATIYAGTDSTVYRSDDAGLHWSRFSVPTPGGVLTLLLSPGTPGVLYAGTGTGVFVSTDRGETWTASGLDGQAVYALASDPQSPATLYAGAWLPVFPETGVIWRSRDGGMQWEQLYAEAYAGPVVALAIDPVDPSVLFAATSDGAGLMRSLDSGASWAQVDPRQGAIHSILIDPVSPSTVYASWGSGASPGYFPTVGSVRKSLDGGNSWFDALLQFSVGSMEMDPHSPSVLFVEANGQLLRTPDGGENWAAIAPTIYADVLLTDPSDSATLFGAGYGGVQRLESIPGPCVASATALCLQEGRFRVETVWRVSPSGPSMQGLAVPVSGEAGYFWFFDSGNVEIMVKVLDGTFVNGHFWVFYASLSDVAFTVSVTDLTTGETRTYENAAGQLASVADTSAFPSFSAPGAAAVTMAGRRAAPIGRSAAVSWTAIGPEPQRGVYALAVDPRYPDVYAGTGGDDYTLFKTNDSGVDWVPLVTFPDLVTELRLDLHAPDIVYAVTASGLYRSADAGGTWPAMAPGLGAACLAPDFIAAGTIYAGTPNGFFVSTDHGGTWAVRGAELSGKPVGPIATTSSGRFYAVADGRSLWASDDSGLSWTLMHEFPNEGLQSLVAPSADPFTVYISESCCGGVGTIPIPVEVPVWKSKDGGSTWTEILRTDRGANAILLDPSDPSVLYVGGHAGVLRSANGGASWTQVNVGLSGPVFTLALEGSTLFAGTIDGAFRLDLSDLPGSCHSDAHTLCLQENRFQVKASWQASPLGPTVEARTVPLTGDTGYFYFFDEANVELVVKVLDGRAVNGHFWVFYGALSNLSYTITVTDTQTGETQTYVNPLGKLASVADTTAF